MMLASLQCQACVAPSKNSSLLAEATGEKKRNFVETIELQIGSKNYDPQRDKRFSVTAKLPNIPPPRMSVCILAGAADIDRGKQIEPEYMSVDDLKRLNKNKKLVKKLAKKYDAFLAIKQTPRLLGPGLSKAGKLSTPVSHAEGLANEINEVRAAIKLQLKKFLRLGLAIGHVQMTDDQVLGNVMLSILPSQEELAKHQVSSHQVDHGPAGPSLLS